jgi:hypothetical protein
MSDPIDKDTLIAKIEQALQLLRYTQDKRPRLKVEMAIASLESARDDLLGKKPS